MDMVSRRIKGKWTQEEDNLLRKCVEAYGEGNWYQVPQRAGLNRCRKSCRLRWLDYLQPNIKRGDFGDDEIDLIIRLHKLLGNKWSLIAGRLPGRTANEIKNYWNCHLSKKLMSNKKMQESSTVVRKESLTVVRPQARTLIARPLPESHAPSPPNLPPPPSSHGLSRCFPEHARFWYNMLMENAGEIGQNIHTSVAQNPDSMG
ncbi:hypothetical protein ACHQM5_003733 [Ranunculus cassubicifolius]